MNPIVFNPRNVALPAEISDIWPSESPTIKRLTQILGTLPAQQSLRLVAKANLVVSDPKISPEGIHDFERGIINTEEARQTFEAWSNTGGADVKPQYRLLFAAGLLEITPWIAVFSPRFGHTLDQVTADQQTDLLKAILIAGSIWSHRNQRDVERLSGQRLSGVDLLLRPAMIGNAASPYAATNFTIARGCLIVGDKLTQIRPGFAAEFEAATGISLEDYYIGLAAVLSLSLGLKIQKKEIAGIIDADRLDETCKPDFVVSLRRFLAIESQGVDQLASEYSTDLSPCPRSFDDVPPMRYEPLRNRPLLVLDSRYYTALDPRILAEKAVLGPVFHVLRSAGHSKRRRDLAQNLFSDFGAAFEEYCLSILRRVYPNLGTLGNMLFPNVSLGTTGEIDAVIDFGVVAVIIEFKFATIPERTLLDPDDKEFLSLLRKRYVEDHGISQLVNAIRRILREPVVSNDLNLSKARIFVPLMVVHDPLMIATFSPRFFSDEFKAMMSVRWNNTDRGQAKDGQWILKPIVLKIEDLEWLENLSYHYSLRDMFLEYSIQDPNRDDSIHNYMYYHNEYSKHAALSPSLDSAMDGFIDAALHKAFGVHLDEALKDEQS